eukprot:366278-Chlamydomonas_euryale.AAC.32
MVCVRGGLDSALAAGAGLDKEARGMPEEAPADLRGAHLEADGMCSHIHDTTATSRCPFKKAKPLATTGCARHPADPAPPQAHHM